MAEAGNKGQDGGRRGTESQEKSGQRGLQRMGGDDAWEQRHWAALARAVLEGRRGSGGLVCTPCQASAKWVL